MSAEQVARNRRPVYLWSLSRRARLTWIAVGMVAAVALTFFSIFRVDIGSASVSWRHPDRYQATELLLVSVSGARSGTRIGPDGAVAGLFAQIANSDRVHGLLLKSGPLHGSYVASQLFDRPRVTESPKQRVIELPKDDGTNGRFYSYPLGALEHPPSSLPFISITSSAGNSQQATQVATRVSNTLIAYIRDANRQSTGPPGSTFSLLPVSLPTPRPVGGHELAKPLLIFVALITLLAAAAITTARASTPKPEN